MSSAGLSNVGAKNIYESDDQRNLKQSEKQEAKRYNQGERNAHIATDSKDERTIRNKLAAEERRADPDDDIETIRYKKDPTLPAKVHGNEPSRGAKIDAELARDDEERLKQKGKA